MPKMTIADAATHFNVSKEAIHNRIRRGTLDCIIENGVKYVAVSDNSSGDTAQSHSDQRYYDYIEAENVRLKERVGKLENETTMLRDQREAMLIAEKEKIEHIYKERDEQLKTVLHVVASKFLTAQNVNQVIDDAISGEEESQDAELVEETPAVIEEAKADDLISLKKFLKLKDFSKSKREKIKLRFIERAKKDTRIIVKNNKLYLRPNTYDYGDLL